MSWKLDRVKCSFTWNRTQNAKFLSLKLELVSDLKLRSIYVYDRNPITRSEMEPSQDGYSPDSESSSRTGHSQTRNDRKRESLMGFGHMAQLRL